MKNTEELLQFDRQHLWHPYASATEPPPVLPVRSASGVNLRLFDGTELIDGISSWWCVAHGHNHPAIRLAIEEQLGEFCQVMFAGFTHRNAARLAELLLERAPGLSRVFYADSGSVAVEVAIKMALQYQYAAGRPGRTRLVTVRGGYHGDTAGAMAVCDPEGMHRLFAPLLAQHRFLERPACAFDQAWNETFARRFREELAALDPAELAGVILEPIFQGAGGMYFYHPEYLRLLRAWCSEHDVLLIFDEIASGCGRTGKFFAMEHAGVTPDLLCVGKALTGGAITLAAVLSSERVAGGISSGEPGKFMHGPTFMANPLACAAGRASLELFATDEWRGQVAAIERQLRAELAPAATLPGVRAVRALGAVGVIELEQALSPAAILPVLLRHGVWLRPFGNFLYTMPPFIITPAELSRVTGCMLELAGSGS